MRASVVIRVRDEAGALGRALNLGAAACAAEVIVALSAHAFPRDEGWLERMARPFADARVACAFGPERDWAGRELRDPVDQDLALQRAHPEWGYSNGAGAFRAALWRERPFREDLPATEDREWALWALAAGHVCRLDPALAVDHDHDHLQDQGRHRSRARARLDPRRAARLAGRWAGSR